MPGKAATVRRQAERSFAVGGAEGDGSRCDLPQDRPLEVKGLHWTRRYAGTGAAEMRRLEKLADQETKLKWLGDAGVTAWKCHAVRQPGSAL